MKKLIFLFAFAAIVCSCSSLKIIMNSVDKNGQRTVVTSNAHLFNVMAADFDAALGAQITGKDTVLAVLITSNKDSDHGIFNKGDRMMIRLADSSEIIINNVYDKEFDTSVETNYTTDTYISYVPGYVYNPYVDAIMLEPRQVTSFIPRTYVTKTTNSYALYLLSHKQLNDIMKKEVIKLRVEIEDKDIDMPNPYAAQSVFTQLWECLKEGIQNPPVRTKF